MRYTAQGGVHTDLVYADSGEPKRSPEVYELNPNLKHYRILIPPTCNFVLDSWIEAAQTGGTRVCLLQGLLPERVCLSNFPAHPEDAVWLFPRLRSNRR